MSDTFSFLLALTTGHKVSVKAGWFWLSVVQEENRPPKPPLQIHAIQVSTTEDHLIQRLAYRHEFRENFDYSLSSVPALKSWLQCLVQDRRHGDYDSVEEFLQDFSDYMARPEPLPPPKHNRRAPTPKRVPPP